MEEIEIRVYPGGRIEAEVKGVKGRKCLGMTDWIKSLLGAPRVTPKREMYDRERQRCVTH